MVLAIYAERSIRRRYIFSQSVECFSICLSVDLNRLYKVGCLMKPPIYSSLFPITLERLVSPNGRILGGKFEQILIHICNFWDFSKHKSELCGFPYNDQREPDTVFIDSFLWSSGVFGAGNLTLCHSPPVQLILPLFCVPTHRSSLTR